MKKRLLFTQALILSTTFLTLEAQDWNEIINATASDTAANDSFGYSVAIDGDYAIVGAYRDDDAGSSSGSAYIFLRSGANWEQQDKLTASDGVSGDSFGWSVSIAGNYAIVGATGDSGSAYIFMRSGIDWNQQAKLTASDAATGDSFGYSVDIDGDYAIVGASGASGASGSTYIYKRSISDWTDETKLSASIATAGDSFGHSVAIDGDYAIVGAYANDSFKGAAYIFIRSGSSWTEDAKLTASDVTLDDLFGWSVAIDGDYAIVGAFLNDAAGINSGSAYIFMRSGTDWTEEIKLTASDAASFDSFGQAVSIDGDYAIVGTSGSSGGSGSAYIFMRSGTSWPEQNKLTASDANGSDNFGQTVSIDGDYAIIGAPKNDEAGFDSGSAYFFESGISPPVTQDWNEIINTTSSDAAANDQFGYSVDIDGDYAIVGAIGNNGSGAAYILTRSGNNWIEQAKLTASDAAISDQFGFSVSLSGDYAIVGVSGNDDALTYSGSAYIFVRSGTTWMEQAKLTASDASTGDFFGASVAIDGDYAIVGAYSDDDGTSFNSGSAYIFLRSESNWTEQTKLVAADAADGDSFGWSVAIDGEYVIVGARNDDDEGSSSGSAYIFMRSVNIWEEQIELTASDASPNDEFGCSVSIDGNSVIVGAYRNDSAGGDSGSAYIFVGSGSNWTQQVKLNAPDAAPNDFFGFDVAIDNDYAIVGAHLNDDTESNSGSAYIFVRSESIWTEQAKLTASDVAVGDFFGYSVAIDGDYVLIGASNDDDDDAGANSGSAYFFEPNIPPVTYTFNNGWTPSDPSGVAVADDAIIISFGDATISSNTFANSITIEAGASLTVNAELTATSEITLNSSSTSFASLVSGASGTIIGSVIYNRFVNSNILGNDLISAPLSGQTWTSFLDPANATALLDNAGPTIIYAFAPFDKTTGDFENYNFNTNTTLTSGTGYRAATDAGETLVFSGTVPETTVSVNIVDSGAQFTEWNLVGNPYPSYMNVQEFLNHSVGTGVSNLDLLASGSAAIYGYDGNLSDGWTIYNLATTTSSTVIAPGQGFFVSADIANVAAYDLEFTNGMQVTGNSDDFITGRHTELVYLKLDLSSDVNSYKTEFYFNANASKGLDKGYDTELWGATAPEFSIYSHLLQDNIGRPIGLQTFNPNNLTDISIPLGVNASQGEQIRFSISESTLHASVNVYLDDTVAHITTLLNNGDYVITPTINLTGTGRFFLRTTEGALSTIETNIETLNIYVLNSSKELIVRGQLQENTLLNLYDIQGRKVLSNQLDSSVVENRINMSALSGGIYVVNIQNEMGQKTQKVVIK